MATINIPWSTGPYGLHGTSDATMINTNTVLASFFYELFLLVGFPLFAGIAYLNTQWFKDKKNIQPIRQSQALSDTIGISIIVYIFTDAIFTIMVILSCIVGIPVNGKSGPRSYLHAKDHWIVMWFMLTSLILYSLYTVYIRQEENNLRRSVLYVTSMYEKADYEQFYTLCKDLDLSVFPISYFAEQMKKHNDATIEEALENIRRANAGIMRSRETDKKIRDYSGTMSIVIHENSAIARSKYIPIQKVK